jgi:GMP synthase-like glutamine amidotransferase
MLIFVDNEHVDAYAKPWGEKIMAARIRIKYRLEDMTGAHCLIVRYNQVTPELLDQLEAEAIFISGSSANPNEYDPAELAGLHSVITSKQWPVFGFCGGFEVLVEAFGAPLAPIGALAEGEVDFNPNFAPGMKKEFGYQPIQITKPHPLLDGLGEAPIMREAHSWEAKAVPDEFANYGETAVSPHQIFIHNTHPIIGTQFHPEYYTDEHPAGRVLIENFCRLAGLIP